MSSISGTLLHVTYLTQGKRMLNFHTLENPVRMTMLIANQSLMIVLILKTIPLAVGNLKIKTLKTTISPTLLLLIQNTTFPTMENPMI